MNANPNRAREIAVYDLEDTLFKLSIITEYDYYNRIISYELCKYWKLDQKNITHDK